MTTTIVATTSAATITAELTSISKGRHAELLAQTAYLANGFEVSEPISPLSYDLSARDPDTGETVYIQVKTAFLRDEVRYGGQYLVVRGARNNGSVYRKEEVDVFVAVWDGAVYSFPNREKSEYWVKPEDLATRWTKMETGI